MLENKPGLLCRLVVKRQSNGVRIYDKEIKRALLSGMALPSSCLTADEFQTLIAERDAA
ncbi:hypothetical protein [Glaciimonas sp. PAMC28666]|uniref:hypothetical protein n=1 Tax=Glaciimonas sp. PAMC28666 TaxID=2807626 RepID=UPI00351C4C6B